MADIKLSFDWEITSDGGVKINLAPEGGPTIGHFDFEEDLIRDELLADLEEFKGTDDITVLEDWDDLADALQQMAEFIVTKTATARHERSEFRRALRAKLLAGSFS